MRNNNEKVLFIIEQYCDNDPNKGLTNNYHNLLGSFKRTYPNIPFNVVHFDTSLREHNIHIDKLLPSIVEKYKPTIVIVSFLGFEPCNPTKDSFKMLKDKGMKTIVMWPDIGDQKITSWIEDLGKLVDLNVGWDNSDSEFHRSWSHPNNFIQLFVPQDPRLYSYHPHKDIICSFIGSPRYYERQVYLSHALQTGCPITIKGGQREEKLSAEQYANLIKRSQISLNFPAGGGGGFDQVKGRVNEVLACCSLLFERKNNATSKLFVPGRDYVEFGDPNDLVNKLAHYINNPAEAQTIAVQGHKTYNENYTAKHFWQAIFERVEIR